MAVKGRGYFSCHLSRGQAASDRNVPATELTHPFQGPPKPIRSVDAPFLSFPCSPSRILSYPGHSTLSCLGLFPFFCSLYPRSTPSALTFFLEPIWPIRIVFPSLSTHSELESARPSGKSFILSLTSFVLLHRLACERKQPTFFHFHLHLHLSPLCCRPWLFAFQSRLLAILEQDNPSPAKDNIGSATRSLIHNGCEHKGTMRKQHCPHETCVRIS